MEVSTAVSEWGINDIVANNLVNSGISHFFPVQQDVIPLLMRNNAHLCIRPRDVCVSAPTGSGKTISYAVPIMSILMRETTRRLRALILLPSRELAIQVHKVMEQLAEGASLKMALVTGQRNFEEEQAVLVGSRFGSAKRKRSLSERLYSNDALYEQEVTSLGRSNVDILICTPGRLLDHLQQTEGFTLQHLRFLVLDEADRLLGNAYQGWVRLLLQSAHSANSIHSGDDIDALFERSAEDAVSSQTSSFSQPLQRLLFSATLTDNPNKLALLGIYSPLLVHSSALRAPSTEKPQTLSALLDDDNEDDGQEEGETGQSESALFVLPQSLSESRITCETEKQPLVLLSILAEVFSLYDINTESETVTKSKSVGHRDLCPADSSSIVIIFASSVKTTHLLCRLLQLANSQLESDKTHRPGFLFRGRVAELSSMMRAEEREQTLRDARAGHVRILVATDQVARGIDLPNIRLVINYGLPTVAEKYVHRAGRTARAHKDGHCLTILKKNQDAQFLKLRSTIGGGADSALPKCLLNKATEDNVCGIHQEAYKQLSSVVKKESSGELSSRHNA